MFYSENGAVKEELENIKKEAEELKGELKMEKEQVEVCKAHLRSLVEILTDLLEYILTK